MRTRLVSIAPYFISLSSSNDSEDIKSNLSQLGMPRCYCGPVPSVILGGNSTRSSDYDHILQNDKACEGTSLAHKPHSTRGVSTVMRLSDCQQFIYGRVWIFWYVFMVSVQTYGKEEFLKGCRCRHSSDNGGQLKSLKGES